MVDAGELGSLVTIVVEGLVDEVVVEVDVDV